MRRYFRYLFCLSALFALLAFPAFAAISLPPLAIPVAAGILAWVTAAGMLAWVVAHQALLITIAGILTPSIFTALTAHPTAYTPALIALLKLVCARFSIAEHADSIGPGFKLPFTAATPSDHPQAIVLGAARGYARIGALMSMAGVCITIAAISSCSLFKPSLKQDELVCAGEAVSALESDAISDITGKAIASSDQTWQQTGEADAVAAAASLGPAAICALEVLAKDFDPSGSSSSPDAGAPAPARASSALVNACAGNGNAPCGPQGRAKTVAQRLRLVALKARAQMH